MAVALETIVKQLTDSGIIAQGQLENFVPPKAQPKDADELIAQLVKESHLTKFQAAPHRGSMGVRMSSRNDDAVFVW